MFGKKNKKNDKADELLDKKRVIDRQTEQDDYNDESDDIDGYEEEFRPVKRRSSLSEFVERPIPSENEVAEFEEIIEDEIREEEIDDSLQEIYQNDKDDSSDVNKLIIKKRRGLVFYFFSLVFFCFFCLAAGMTGYYYFYRHGINNSALELSIDGQNQVSAGEDVTYVINYKNSGNIGLKNISLDIVYPSGFIFEESQPAPVGKNNSWKFEHLSGRASDKVVIHGKFIDKKGVLEPFKAVMSYYPDNFSSQFSRETVFNTNISGIGWDLELDCPSLSFVGEESEVVINITPLERNFIDTFNLRWKLADNIKFVSLNTDEGSSSLKLEKNGTDSYDISGLSGEIKKLHFKYKIDKKVEDKQDIVFSFGQYDKDSNIKDFAEETASFEVARSDLNVTILSNNSSVDNSVDFGQVINYSIKYSNKGDKPLRNLSLMAVLEGDYLDWASLKDLNNGLEQGNTITWTKNEVPALEEIAANGEGVLDFSITLKKNFNEKISRSAQVRSYVQFSLNDGSGGEVGKKEENRGNTVVSKINSDLNFKEQVRYFDEDNIPVGSGPLPPKAGEKTNLRVYWSLTNNLHELKDVQIEVVLPEYVNWTNRSKSLAGSFSYDESSRKVTWRLGRLPVTVYKAEADFDIEVAPTQGQSGRILVILSGTRVSATDSETSSVINRDGKITTTKLEDDDISAISNDGIVK